jgi:signal transduction histidine kinase
MILITTVKRLIVFFLSLLFAISFLDSNAQQHHLPLSKPENIDVIENFDNKTQDLLGKNLNRFAYEKLVRYNHVLDSLYKIEKKDTLKSIEQNYLSRTATVRAEIDSLNSHIRENSALKVDLEKRYWGLVRKAVISFVLWFVIVIVVLQIRKRKLKQANKKLESTNIQLQVMEESSAYAEKLIAELKSEYHNIERLNQEYLKVHSLITAGEKGVVPSAEWNEIIKKSDGLKKSIELEANIVNAVVLQQQEIDENKESANINELCERYVEIVTRGFFLRENFTCQITKDFEKRLPDIKVNTAAIGTLLLNIITNAIQSVRDQSLKGVKGYQPKVAISTRILPRFLQIRIRDNGTGMTENILDQSTAEFYSTRPLNEGSGLGLFVANDIIKNIHKGEIKIESEAGASTDVYIKFYI